MPIDYKEYHPEWKSISLRIRTERAGNKCEWCARANGSAWVNKGDGKWEEDDDMRDAQIAQAFRNYGWKITRIVLTVAHIDHDKTNNDDANLAALCQRCHLNHDRHQHAENRRNGRNWKRDQTKMEL